MRLPAPKAEDRAHETNENGRFQEPAAVASPYASPSSQNTLPETSPELPVESELATALSMIERLPLTDDEKAEAVRRLLASCDT